MKDSRIIIWTPRVRRKLLQYRSEKYTPEETYDFLAQTVLEAETLLSNPILSRTYKEEYDDYKGVSRIVINKFRIYYELNDGEVTVVAVLFPGENQTK